MRKLRLLIVDDDEDNRVILKAICKKLDGFEIREATDGIEAVQAAEEWQPHVILMDIMMPNLDGFEASKIIKQKYPQIVIMAVTAATDSRIQENMSAIGVDIYIHKPIDRELIRFKLQSIGSSLHLKQGNYENPSKKMALNPFNSDIRSFKTFFDIVDSEGMMDFGMWLFDQYYAKTMQPSRSFDKVLEVFYTLMNQGNKNGETMSIIIEESYEEFYITMKFDTQITLDEKLTSVFEEFDSELLIKDNIVCARLRKSIEKMPEKEEKVQIIEKKEIEQKIEIKKEEIQKVENPPQEEPTITKEVKKIESNEKEMLKQSFVNKTSAVDYINDIGGDVLDEILDLSSIDEEWGLQLRNIEDEATVQNITHFADSVLYVYVRAINNLFEFTALAYSLSSLSAFLKDSAQIVCEDPAQVKMLVMLLEHLRADLASWREHIFILQDTADIHYLDSSFFSSCMQIEGIISNKEIDAHDDDNDIEFF